MAPRFSEMTVDMRELCCVWLQRLLQIIPISYDVNGILLDNNFIHKRVGDRIFWKERKQN